MGGAGAVGRKFYRGGWVGGSSLFFPPAGDFFDFGGPTRLETRVLSIPWLPRAKALVSQCICSRPLAIFFLFFFSFFHFVFYWISLSIAKQLLSIS